MCSNENLAGRKKFWRVAKKDLAGINVKFGGKHGCLGR